MHKAINWDEFPAMRSPELESESFLSRSLTSALRQMRVYPRGLPLVSPEEWRLHGDTVLERTAPSSRLLITIKIFYLQHLPVVRNLDCGCGQVWLWPSHVKLQGITFRPSLCGSARSASWDHQEN